MTGFCLQEFLISSIYLFQTIKLLNVVKTDFHEARRTMFQLAIINVIIVIMDIALLGIEYDNQTVYEQVFKGVFYSVKLKLEFAILGKLVQIVDKNRQTMNRVLGGPDPIQDKTGLENGSVSGAAESDFVDRSKSTDDPRYAKSSSRSPVAVRSRSWALDRTQRDSVTKDVIDTGRQTSVRGRTQHVEKMSTADTTDGGHHERQKRPSKLSRMFGRSWDKSHAPTITTSTAATTDAGGAAEGANIPAPQPSPSQDHHHQQQHHQHPIRQQRQRRLTLSEALKMDSEDSDHHRPNDHVDDDSGSTSGSDEEEEVDLYADALREVARA